MHHSPLPPARNSLSRIFLDPLEHLAVMPLGFHLLEDAADHSVLANDKGGPRNTHVLPAVHAPLLPDAVALGNRVVSIGLQREVQVKRAGERGDILHWI